MVNINYVKKMVNSLETHINDINTKYLKVLKNRNDNNILSTKENLSLVISNGIVDDVKTLLSLHFGKMKDRYMNYIIRGMVEQVIEYKYLILNENLIEEYFGGKANFRGDLDYSRKEINIVKEFKELGKNRYKNGRENIRKMAKEIKEDLTNSSSDSSSLYDVFCITSEESHNSYFQEYLKYLDDELEEKEEEEGLSEVQVTFIFIIIKKFLETYDNI